MYWWHRIFVQIPSCIYAQDTTLNADAESSLQDCVHRAALNPLFSFSSPDRYITRIEDLVAGKRS